MIKYECEPCGYIYDPAVGDPDAGIEPETAFEDIPAVSYTHLDVYKRQIYHLTKKETAEAISYLK